MTSRKTHSISKPTPKPASKPEKPSRVATTIATGSTDPNDPGQAGTPATATVHDLVGLAVLILPPDVRVALGEQYLLGSALELESQEIVVIARENGVVAYIRLPIVVKEMEYPGSELRNGMVLHDITGQYARQKEHAKAHEKAYEKSHEEANAPPKAKMKAKAKAKPKPKVKTKASTATKPTGKAPRHA
jgi:hypothetical protein